MSYKLEKPYTDKQRADFIVEYNHNQGLVIEETEMAIYALKPNEYLENNQVKINENYESEQLQEAKESKLKEALEKAYEYENKTGLISFDGRTADNPETTQVLHVELFNQSKFFQMVIGFTQGILTQDQLYNTKEDINVLINALEAQAIYFAIKDSTEKLWTADYPGYKQMITDCTTIEQVNNIVINYE